jgi:hypothetical protein
MGEAKFKFPAMSIVWFSDTAILIRVLSNMYTSSAYVVSETCMKLQNQVSDSCVRQIFFETGRCCSWSWSFWLQNDYDSQSSKRGKMQQKLKQAVSISRGVDWNLWACLVKFPPDIVTPEELNRKTGSVNCIRTGIMWLFVFAGAMVLSCTSGLSLSDTETEGVRIVHSKEKETKSKHTLYIH